MGSRHKRHKRHNVPSVPHYFTAQTAHTPIRGVPVVLRMRCACAVTISLTMGVSTKNGKLDYPP